MGHRPGDPIQWKLHLPVPCAEVYAALDSDAGRAAFWAEAAPEHDGHVDFRFANGLHHRARILAREPGRSWCIGYFGGQARFDLAGDGAQGTVLTLTHEGVAPGEWHEVHAGWLNVLLPLKAWLVHGADLRNHDPSRSWDQGFADG